MKIKLTVDTPKFEEVSVFDSYDNNKQLIYAVTFKLFKNDKETIIATFCNRELAEFFASQRGRFLNDFSREYKVREVYQKD